MLADVIVDVRERGVDDKGDTDRDERGDVGVEMTTGLEEATDDSGGSLNI